MTDVRQQLTEALDEAERVALEASRDGESRTATGEHWHWECSNCDTPIPIDGVAVLEEFLSCPACDSCGVGLRSVEQYETRSVGELPHLVTHGAEEIRPVDALHIARWSPATVLRLVKRDRELLKKHDEAVAFYSAPGNLRYPAGEAAALKFAVDQAAAFWLGPPEVDR